MLVMQTSWYGIYFTLIYLKLKLIVCIIILSSLFLCFLSFCQLLVSLCADFTVCRYYMCIQEGSIYIVSVA
jgi:hypothetical protein